MLSNKNKTYTPRFRAITDKYDLNLNKQWNIRPVFHHLGRHTNAYHDFMLGQINAIDGIANGDTGIFLVYFNALSDYVVAHPGIMYLK